jgi:Nucleotidyl transferase AbiEii toxin, Type IV TA system
LAFERFLARLAGSGEWMLKGGFALEMSYGWSARPTKDIDLRAAGDLDTAFVLLRTTIAEAPEAADHLTFELSAEAQLAPSCRPHAVTVPGRRH